MASAATYCTLWPTPSDFCTLCFNFSLSFTLEAAPPVMMDLIKIPRSCIPCADAVVLPLTLTPSPAEPVSFKAMFIFSISLFLLDVMLSSSPALSGGCGGKTLMALSWELCCGCCCCCFKVHPRGTEARAREKDHKRYRNNVLLTKM